MLVPARVGGGTIPWTSIKNSGIGGDVKYRKDGEIVSVNIMVSSGVSNSTLTTLASLPNGAKPTTDFYTCGLVKTGTNDIATIYVSSGGSIQAQVSGSTDKCYHCFSFVANS